jgi:hypothetical protein
MRRRGSLAGLLAALGLSGCGYQDFDPVQTRSSGPTASLEVELLPVLSQVDLTALGELDWVHWGFGGVNAETRKLGGTGEIGELVVTYPPEDGFGLRPVDDDTTGYSWTDGTPVESALQTPSGVYVTGAGAQVEISAAALPETRELTAYFGGWHARLELSVELTGSPPYTRSDIVRDAADLIGVPIRVRYAAPDPGARVSVTLSVVETLVEEGNVTAAAATLRR